MPFWSHVPQKCYKHRGAVSYEFLLVKRVALIVIIASRTFEKYHIYRNYVICYLNFARVRGFHILINVHARFRY